MVGHGVSSAGSYLADPTSPIPSHCVSIVVTSTLRVKISCNGQVGNLEHFSESTWSKILTLCVPMSIASPNSSTQSPKRMLNSWSTLKLQDFDVINKHQSIIFVPLVIMCRCHHHSHQHWYTSMSFCQCESKQLLT